MRAADEFLAPGFHEFSVAVEDHHGVVAFARGIHGVVDINVALRILAHAMRVAVFDRGGQFAPVVSNLVIVVAFAKNRLGAAGFIGCAEEDRRGSEKAYNGAAGGLLHGPYCIAASGPMVSGAYSDRAGAWGDVECPAHRAPADLLFGGLVLVLFLL